MRSRNTQTSKYDSFNKVQAASCSKSELQLMGYNFYAWNLRVTKRPLSDFLPTALHSITTNDWQVCTRVLDNAKNAREEAKQSKLYQCAETLKQAQMWSFKQIKPHQESIRPKTHHDLLIDEMVRFEIMITSFD